MTLGFVLLVLTSCGGGGGSPKSASSGVDLKKLQSDIAALPDCSKLIDPHHKVVATEWRKGCMKGGSVQIAAEVQCTDGRNFYSINGAAGRVGDYPYTFKSSSTDPHYTKDNDDCTGVTSHS